MAAFEHRLEDHLLALQAELLTGSYRPGGYRSFLVHEPKRRLISAAPFRDRVAHHALCNLIEPVFERSFTADSFANRRGRGTHRALCRCQRLARRHRYALQCDVRQFFPSIDHALLRGEIARKLTDPRVLALVDRILESGRGVLSEEYRMVYFPGDVRYVDDLLLFDDDKPRLWQAKGELARCLERLRLTLHPGAHPRPVAEGIPFLGFVTFPDRRRLKRRKGVAFRRRLKRLRELEAAGALSADAVQAAIAGWVAHVRYGNTVGLRKAALGEHRD